MTPEKKKLHKQIDEYLHSNLNNPFHVEEWTDSFQIVDDNGWGVMLIDVSKNRIYNPSSLIITRDGENAELPILVTPSGMATLVRLVQPENAALPILVTPSGKMVFLHP